MTRWAPPRLHDRDSPVRWPKMGNQFHNVAAPDGANARPGGNVADVADHMFGGTCGQRAAADKMRSCH
jgi:hypothetical protein